MFRLCRIYIIAKGDDPYKEHYDTDFAHLCSIRIIYSGLNYRSSNELLGLKASDLAQMLRFLPSFFWLRPRRGA